MRPAAAFFILSLIAELAVVAESRQAPLYSPLRFPQLRLPAFPGFSTGAAFKPCAKPARYSIVNKCDWNPQRHPNDFPSNAHFSPLCGTAHSKGVKLFELGGIASDGVKLVAETGECDTLRAEIELCRSIGKCSGMQSHKCNPFGGTCTHSGSVTVSPQFPLLSFLTMVAPSPDWFSGIDSIDLCKNGGWIPKYEMDLYADDAGTDGGVSFQSLDAPFSAREPISRFNSRSLSNIFYNQNEGKLYPICRMTLSLINLTG